MNDCLLPENYAQKLFELEASLEYEGTMNTIRQLNDHYGAGIDYYLEREPRKATHLQKKMTALLANPDNIRILERESKKVQNESESVKETVTVSKVEERTPVLNSRKLNEQVSKFKSVADSCIKNMMQNSNKMVDRLETLKKKDLNRQEQKFNDRIMLKRMKSQQKFKIKSQTQLPISIGLATKAQQSQLNSLKSFIE